MCEFLRWLIFFDEMNFVEQGKLLYFLHSEKNYVFIIYSHTKLQYFAFYCFGIYNLI